MIMKSINEHRLTLSASSAETTPRGTITIQQLAVISIAPEDAVVGYSVMRIINHNHKHKPLSEVVCYTEAFRLKISSQAITIAVVSAKNNEEIPVQLVTYINEDDGRFDKFPVVN